MPACLKIYTAALNEVQFDTHTVNGIPSPNPMCQKNAIATGMKGFLPLIRVYCHRKRQPMREYDRKRNKSISSYI